MHARSVKQTIARVHEFVKDFFDIFLTRFMADEVIVGPDSSVPQRQGSANTISVLPRGAPYSSGAKPFIQAPHPVGTATYCLPLTL